MIENKVLTDFLAKFNVSIDDIKEVYSGADHACRCGCCGKYYKKGDKGFNRVISNMVKKVKDLDYKKYVQVRIDSETNSVYFIDFSYSEELNKAYTIYFE